MDKISIILLDKNESVDLKKLDLYLTQKNIEYKLLYATDKEVKTTNKNIKNFVFENFVDDEVVNFLMEKVDESKLLLLRKIENNDFSVIMPLVKALKEENQVAFIKKQRNKFMQKLFDFFNFIVSYMYNFTLFDANLSASAFSKVPINILKQFDNNSTYTKINKFTGIDVVYVDGYDALKIKFKQGFKYSILPLLIYCVLIAACITLLALNVASKMFMLKVLLYFVLLVCFVLFVIKIIRNVVFHLVGDSTSVKSKIKIKEKKNGKNKSRN